MSDDPRTDDSPERNAADPRVAVELGEEDASLSVRMYATLRPRRWIRAEFEWDDDGEPRVARVAETRWKGRLPRRCYEREVVRGATIRHIADQLGVIRDAVRSDGLAKMWAVVEGWPNQRAPDPGVELVVEEPFRPTRVLQLGISSDGDRIPDEIEAALVAASEIAESGEWRKIPWWGAEVLDSIREWSRRWA